jgi:predicted KAP-like P-loop ATPase
MTIHPPKVAVDKEEPFKHALFGREEFGKSLFSILRNVSDNLAIFVNAPWGAGKTTFAQMWLTHLREQQKLEVVYYDAYASDYFDDPFVSFSGEIVELTKRLAGEKGLVEREEFKKSAIEVGKRLAGLATKIGLRAATLGAIESAHVNELKDIGSEIATGVSEIGSDIIKKKIENYAAEKDGLILFKTRLTKLAAKVREEQGFPLTIIVDELDRCRPDFALSLLERMKHLFDVEGLAFVLLVNRDQIENYIRAVYGYRVDARSYLLKFGNLFVDLPSSPSDFGRGVG